MKFVGFFLLLLACFLVSDASAQAWHGALPGGCAIIDDENVDCNVSCSDGSSYEIFCNLDDAGDFDDFGDDEGYCRFGGDAKSCVFAGSILDCPGWRDVVPGPCQSSVGALLNAFQFTGGYENDWDKNGDWDDDDDDWDGDK